MKDKDTSKFISLILRHKPEVVGVSLDEQGLIPKSRLYVHLSADEETARKVGSRHGKPVIYIVKSWEMYRNQEKFYSSVNGVWLMKRVSVQYFQKI